MTARSPVARSTQSPTTRIVLRVLGAVLLLAGLFFLIRGGISFASDMSSDSMAEDPGFGPILTLAAGGFLMVFGLVALNAGFLGAQSRFVSGETSAAVREFGSAFRGESPRVSEAVEADGAFCSSCGVRADRGARFCDACGHGLADR